MIGIFNRSTKSWLQENNIEIYSTRNKGISAGGERFIITLKSNIYKHLSSISKNGYIDNLDGIINKYNMTCYSTIKMKAVDVKSSSYIVLNKENNKEYPKFFCKKLYSKLACRNSCD